MAIPSASHLQWLTLAALIYGPHPGHVVREFLSRHRIKKSGPAFYQLMARLEGAGWVKGWYEQKLIDNQPIKERWYKLTPAGKAAWNESHKFYGLCRGG